MTFVRNCGKTASIIIFVLWWFQGKDRKGPKCDWEIMAENFQNLKKETDNQVQEAESQIR